jgi:hypothetical protein
LTHVTSYPAYALISQIIAYAAVLTNSALVAFTGTWAIDYTYSARIWIFLAMTAGLLYVKFLVAEIVPDTPREVGALKCVVAAYQGGVL